jgi:hypothetical protein
MASVRAAMGERDPARGKRDGSDAPCERSEDGSFVDELHDDSFLGGPASS